MELHLDTAQALVLWDVLDDVRHNLHNQVADLHDPRLTIGLNERNRVLTSILSQLRVDVPSAASPSWPRRSSF